MVNELNRVSNKLLENYIGRLNKIIVEYNPNIIVAYEVSGHKTLELCNYKNGSITTVIKVLAYGTKRELVDQIGFYFEFQSQLERILNEKLKMEVISHSLLDKMLKKSACDNRIDVSFDKSGGV